MSSNGKDTTATQIEINYNDMNHQNNKDKSDTANNNVSSEQHLQEQIETTDSTKKYGQFSVCEWISWVFLLLISIMMFIMAARYYSFSDKAFAFSHFKKERYSVYLHIIPASIAMLICIFQFLKYARKKWLHLHRFFGRIYVGCSILSSIFGLALSVYSHGGLTTHFGFGFLAILWFTFTAIAIYFIRFSKKENETEKEKNYRIEQHRQWMIRSCAMIMAAPALRIWSVLNFIPGTSEVDAYRTMSWICWVPNLVIAEFYIWYRINFINKIKE